MKTESAYLNGNWIPRGELSIAVDDVGFLLGATVTERLRTFHNQAFRLDDHLRRLRRSLEIVGLNAAGITSQIGRALGEFPQRNQGRLAADDDWSLTAFATPGSSEGGPPTVCVYGYPLAFEQWADHYEQGLPIVVSETRQVPTNCWPAELKCRSRMHYFLADRAAAAAQPGARSILLDQEGFVGESTTANVLLYCEGEGLVSPTAEHILYGVSMGVVEELAAALGVPFLRRRIAVDELQTADELMLASTSICLLPVVACDQQPIGDGAPGPIYRRLLAAWGEAVGLDVAEQAWRCAARRVASGRSRS